MFAEINRAQGMPFLCTIFLYSSRLHVGSVGSAVRITNFAGRRSTLYLGVSDFVAAQSTVLGQQLQPCGPTDGTVHTSSVQQAFIGGIDDGIHLMVVISFHIICRGMVHRLTLWRHHTIEKSRY